MKVVNVVCEGVGTWTRLTTWLLRPQVGVFCLAGCYYCAGSRSFLRIERSSGTDGGLLILGAVVRYPRGGQR